MTAAPGSALLAIDKALSTMDDLLEAARREIAQLRERVRQLEEEIAPSLVSVPLEWRLTASEARVFAHLTTRTVATKTSIMAALYSDRPDDDPELKIVDVYVCKIRRKVKPYGVKIATVWGQGYSLVDREKWAVRQ